MGHFELPTAKVTWATERLWNGEAYECFLCDSEFKMLEQLNTALAEPAPQGQDIQVSEARLSHQVCHAEWMLSARQGWDLWREDVQTGPQRDGELDKGI